MERTYIKTDKNGTKYYYDWTCPRCGGTGGADKWRLTGWTCYACGGTGKRGTPKTVKEYTPEYWAKLVARQQAKDAKRAAEAAKYAEEHQDEIQAELQRTIERRYAEHGCGKDGTGYVLKGNTYQHRDEIKRAGGKWIYGEWISPVEIKADGIRSKKVSLAGHIGGGSEVWLDDFNFYEAVKL